MSLTIEASGREEVGEEAFSVDFGTSLIREPTSTAPSRFRIFPIFPIHRHNQSPLTTNCLVNDLRLLLSLPFPASPSLPHLRCHSQPRASPCDAPSPCSAGRVRGITRQLH